MAQFKIYLITTLKYFLELINACYEYFLIGYIENIEFPVGFGI